MGCAITKSNQNHKILYLQEQREKGKRQTNQIIKVNPQLNKLDRLVHKDFRDTINKSAKFKQEVKQQKNSKQQKILEQGTAEQINTTHQAILFQFDRRRKANQKLIFPYNCIGQLFFINQFEDGERKIMKPYLATGFLISPHLVITAAHFIQQYEKIGSQTLNFLIGSYVGQSFMQIRYQSRSVTSIHHQRLDIYQNNISQDYALVKIDTPVILQKYIPIGYAFNECQTEAYTYGYPSDNNQKQFNLVGMKGTIKSINKDVIKYDIDTTTGQSGSPIIVQFSSNQYVAVGVHLGKHKKDIYNSGCLMTKKTIDNLELWIGKCLNQTLAESNQANALEQQKYISFVNLQNSCLKIYSFLNQLKPNFQNKALAPQRNSNNYIDEAQFYYCQQNYHKSIALAERGLLRNKNSKNQQSLLFSLIGLNYYQLKQFELALFYYGQSIRCQLQLNNIDRTQYIKCLNYIGEAFIQINQTFKAKAYFNQAKRLSKSTYKRVSKHNLTSLVNEGMVSLSQNQNIKAFSLFSSALKLSFQLSQYIVQQKAYIMHQISAASLNLQKYDDWVQYTFGCLWILKKLNLDKNDLYLEWRKQFIEEAKDMLSQLEIQVQLKIGRIFFLLNISTQNDDFSRTLESLINKKMNKK